MPLTTLGTDVGPGSNALLLFDAALENGSIKTTISPAQIASLISSGTVVILKKAFDADMILDFRRAVVRWAKETPEYPHGKSPNTTPNVNYHRIDDGTIKSSLPHVFHQVGFNNFETLDDYVSTPARLISESMRELQNSVAGTTFELSLNGLRAKLLHYPVGGGFLAQHSHPLEPQRIGLITSLSRLGEDFVVGGTTFLTPFGLVDTNAFHDIGDIMLFRYDLPHGVTKVDQNKQLNWESEAGKWSFVLDLRETHNQSSVAM